MPPRFEVIGVAGLPEIARGVDLGPLIVDAARAQGTPLAAGDLLVVSQKIVSKTEGRLVRLDQVAVSPRAQALALEIGAGAVVTRPMPDNVVAVGVPAKVIRVRT